MVLLFLSYATPKAFAFLYQLVNEKYPAGHGPINTYFTHKPGSSNHKRTRLFCNEPCLEFHIVEQIKLR